MMFTRKPSFWLILTLISITSLFIAFKYFSSAFPIVNLDLTCNRSQAIEKALAIAKTYHLGPINASQAAIFSVDQEVKTFVELEAGGKEALAQMLKDPYYSPYQWYVRLFREYEKNETLIRFKPDGTPYGFVEELSENDKGAALEQDAARAIAEKAAPSWLINLAEYKLVEQRKETKPSGRIDHTFVYERPEIRLGKGYYRLKFTISGDKLTEVTHFVKIPEEFTLKYKEMRSANNSIAAAAKLAMMLLYLLGCCIIGLFFLVRRSAIIWWPGVCWGTLIAFLHVLVEINQLPLQWFEYPTALSMQGFLLKLIVAFIYQFLSMAAMYSISFIAAENLTRAAFGNHIQLWRSWNSSVSSSYAMLGRTIAGYLMVPVDIGFTVIFYIIFNKYFGWWSPSDALIDPNILATYFPWLSSIVYSLGAGFWEECLFRAVPLSTAALIGQRWGNKRAWIIGAFILQILIFGAAHANYAAQPAYARIVELIFFSAVTGLIYLRFGLVPTIITHYVIDVVWFALPVFISSAPGSWINQILIILLALVPMLVVLYGRYRTGAFHELSPTELNSGWQPPLKAPDEKIFTLPEQQIVISLHKYIKPALIASGIFGIMLWLVTVRYHQDAPALSVTMNQAVTIANKDLEKSTISLPATWEPLTWVISEYDENISEELQHTWIWQKGGKDLYHQYIGSYLKLPRIVVRYATFSPTIPVADRAEEYLFSIAKDGTIVRKHHLMAEKKAGASLEEADARVIAHKALKDIFNLDPNTVKEILASPEKMPERKDWTFIFENKAVYPLSEGQAWITIVIDGNEVADAIRSIHVPEAWERAEHNKKNMLKVLEMLCSLLLYLLFCLGLFILFKRLQGGNYLGRAVYYFIPLALIYLITIINGWPSLIASLNTSEPFTNQVFMLLARYGFASLIKAASFSFVISGIIAWGLPYKPHTHSPLLFGSCLGLLVGGLYTLADRLAPSLSPIWASYEELGNYFPWLGEITSAIISYVSLAVMVMLAYIIIDFITNYWQQKKWIGLLTFISLGILMNGLQSIEQISSWLIGGIGIGLILALIYLVIGRYDREALPITVGVFCATQLGQQALFNAYPGALIGNILSIIIVLILAYFWSQTLSREEKQIS